MWVTEPPLQPFLRIDRVSVPGPDLPPTLTGFAALRNTSPESSPRKLLCPRAERGKFASLRLSTGAEPFRQWHSAPRARRRARQGCVGGEGAHSHRLHPSGSRPGRGSPGRAGGRQLRSGSCAWRGGQCHLAGAGMDERPPQRAAGTARTTLPGAPRAPPAASLPSLGSAPHPCLKDVDGRKLK